MVSAGTIFALGAVVLGAVVFTGAGGIDAARKFGSSLKDQAALFTPGASNVEQQTANNESSRMALENSTKQQLLISKGDRFSSPTRGVVTTKVRGVSFTDKPKVKEKLLQRRSGSANISGGGIAKLTQEQIKKIRAAPLTEREKADLKAFERRNFRKEARGQPNRNILDPLETIFLKREQEFISKGIATRRFGKGKDPFVDGKLFGNPDFAGFIKTGQGPLSKSQHIRLGKIRKSIDSRNLSAGELQEIRENQRINAINRDAQFRLGGLVQKRIDESGKSPEQFLKSKGVKLNTSTINERALGRLVQQGVLTL